ncbi:MAG TPA: hypothetical protein VI997_02665 [Candidatus Thermoplasmatota archaeon]|nr:hypothetical protein [Candidatus Thermoplasmatota archaeon]
MPLEPSAPNVRKYTTISIPTPLFQQVEKKIEGTGFRSATEFIVYVTRVAIAEGETMPGMMDTRPRRPTEEAGLGTPGAVREELARR